MPKHPRSSSAERPSTLTDREQDIAERVRQSLHLSPSMSLDEVAEQFRHSAAWRRERLGLVGEELRDGLWRAIRPLLQSVWARLRAGWTWVRLKKSTGSPQVNKEDEGRQD